MLDKLTAQVRGLFKQDNATPPLTATTNNPVAKPATRGTTPRAATSRPAGARAPAARLQPTNSPMPDRPQATDKNLAEKAATGPDDALATEHNLTFASSVEEQKAATTTIKVEDDRSLAQSGGIKFSGSVLTSVGGELEVNPASRALCVLFDNGMWLVSASHRNSPLVTSVASQARRAGFAVNEPRYVTPDIIANAYNYGARTSALGKMDDNAVRRKIVDLLQKAVEIGTNDIHIEAGGGKTKIEFRVDGQLRSFETWTQREGELVLSSVYSHSVGQSGSTANWMEPQAAMLTQSSSADTISLPAGILSVRCQWVPLADGGRYLDMRLQYDSAHLFGENFVMADVDSLGFNQEQLKIIQQLRVVPGGMRVFAGPVNQGKTTTLRVMLNRRMGETNYSLNCLMIEDPPEGGVMGARQIGVSASVKDEQREKSFQEILRCALRLDPDIVMLGETRDIQTAKFAFRLALTGRQVYTTTHVYAALAIPQRFRDIGIEPYLVYDHHLLRGMICQRLLRGMCPHCRIPLRKASQELGYEFHDLARRVRAGLAVMAAKRNPADPGTPWEEKLTEPDLSQAYVANPEGCGQCFKGRVGRSVCVEVVQTDAKLMELLQENRMQDATDYWLSPHGLNGITMLWHGLEKVKQGHVSPNDAEFELGPMADEKELQLVEARLGPMPAAEHS